MSATRRSEVVSINIFIREVPRANLGPAADHCQAVGGFHQTL